MDRQGPPIDNKLVKSIEDMLDKDEELNHQICIEEIEKEQLQHDIRVITERLSKVNESLAQKLHERDTLKRILAECEAAYTKVLECSQSLLTVLKLEAGNVGKAT